MSFRSNIPSASRPFGIATPPAEVSSAVCAPRSDPRRRPRIPPGGLARVAWGGGLAFAVYSLLMAGPWSMETQLALCVAVNLTPWVLPGRLRATNGFELLPFIGAINLIYFGGGALYLLLGEPDRFPGLGWPEISRALLWVNLGSLCCIAGYCLAARWRLPLRSRPVHRVVIDWSRVVPLLVLLGLLCKAFTPHVPSTYTAVLAVFAALCPVGLGFAAYELADADRRRAGPWPTLILFGLPAWLLLALAEGGREQILLPVIYMVIGHRLGSARPFPRAAVVAGLVLAVIGLRFLSDYRLALWSGASTVAALESASEELTNAGPQSYLTDALTLAGERVNYLSTVAVIMQQTPDSTPFLHGETYELFLWAMLVPRFLVPDKPTLGIYNQVAQRYGLVQDADEWTSIALPPVAELYLNFGVPGILVGMALFGALYRALYAWAVSTSRYPGVPVLLYLAMSYPLARGDLFAMTMANVLKLALGLLLVVAAVGVLTRPRVTAPAACRAAVRF